MKRSEMIELMHDTLYKNYGHSDLDLSIPEVEKLLTLIEESGMLPPIQTPSLVEDTYNGGTKHGPAQRVWDKE